MKGGPLGELNQWSDLIAALYILGHDVKISWSAETLLKYVSTPSTPVSTCKVARPADIFYTDIHGVRNRVLGVSGFEKSWSFFYFIKGSNPTNQ